MVMRYSGPSLKQIPYLKVTDHSEDLSVDGRILIKCIIEKYKLSYKLDLSGSENDPEADFLNIVTIIHRVSQNTEISSMPDRLLALQK